jgi:hypothetical protein
MNGTTGGEGGLEHMALQIKQNSRQFIHSKHKHQYFPFPCTGGHGDR